MFRWPGQETVVRRVVVVQHDPLLPFESLLERQAVMVFDSDPGVVGMSVQPFALLWPRLAARGPRWHVPDLFLRCDDGSGVVVDVRPPARLDQRAKTQFGLTRDAVEQVRRRYLTGHRLFVPART